MGALKRTGQHDPLGPLSFIVTLATALLIAALIAIPTAAIFAGGDYGFGAWGLEEPCVEVSQQGLTITGSDAPGYVVNLRPGVTEGTPQTFRLCQKHMDGTARTLFSIPVALDLLWTLGFLLLTQRLIRRARRHGLFTSDVARGVTGLGWYLLAGHVIVNLIGGLSTAYGINHLVTEYWVWAGAIGAMHLSWTIIVAACGVLSVGRIMSRSVEMSEDLVGTV